MRRIFEVKYIQYTLLAAIMSKSRNAAAGRAKTLDVQPSYRSRAA